MIGSARASRAGDCDLAIEDFPAPLNSLLHPQEPARAAETFTNSPSPQTINSGNRLNHRPLRNFWICSQPIREQPQLRS
jgi:hypothetical protein